MHFNVSANNLMNSYGPWGCWGWGVSRKTPAPLGKKHMRVTEDRGVEDSGRRHQMEEKWDAVITPERTGVDHD